MLGAPLRLAILAIVLLGLLAGPAAATGGDSIRGTNGAAVPQLAWGPCPAATPEEEQALAPYQCSVAEVPLSYRDPDGQTIELALGRLPATDQANKLGSLFWNPGGPGGSGRFPFPFSEALHQRFDLVGFDPRGIAASTPVHCFESNEQALRLFGSDFPITPAEERRFIFRNFLGTRLCGRNGGPLLEHMSTANVARDLDLLRQAVGDPQLTYLGYSYGTAIGSYYANLFPRKVRALTLDGVIDPVEWSSSSDVSPIEYRLGSFFGTRRALETFLAACAADARCAFAEPGVDLVRKYERLLARLRREPVEVMLGADQIVANYQFGVGITLGLLYDASLAPALADVLQTLWTATEARAPQALPEPVAVGEDYRPVRALLRQDEPYFGIEWFPAVECTDSENPDNPWQWPRFARLADRQAYPFGAAWVFASQPCATWPAADPDRYAGPFDRKTANPILLIGNSQGDPATPYEDAQQTEQILADARLLTLDSFGHTAQGGRSVCIDAAVDSYLIDLKLPPPGLVCEPDLGPFDPLPAPAARKRNQRLESLPQPVLPMVSR
ncbi:MAG: hypothetical protein QOH58_1702 [Thermoleophilaceae bacterium]|jgi:pimeloyl-ACP methyl ester carboxylesterase|nr:hypothetical protein [Thermoleophilaceae bacterium]